LHEARQAWGSGKTIVYDSAYFDAHDPEQAREAAMKAFVDAFPPDKKPTVVRIKPFNAHDSMKWALTRVIGRANGTIPQGSCAETIDTAAAFLLKLAKNFDANEAALDLFEVWAKDQGCAVISLPFNEARAALLLLA
jgi:hypothetical protein